MKYEEMVLRLAKEYKDDVVSIEKLKTAINCMPTEVGMRFYNKMNGGDRSYETLTIVSLFWNSLLSKKKIIEEINGTDQSKLYGEGSEKFGYTNERLDSGEIDRCIAKMQDDSQKELEEMLKE